MSSTRITRRSSKGRFYSKRKKKRVKRAEVVSGVPLLSDELIVTCSCGMKVVKRQCVWFNEGEDKIAVLNDRKSRKRRFFMAVCSECKMIHLTLPEKKR